MNIQAIALQSPTEDTLQTWLNTPRVALCGEHFTPSEPKWRPDRTSYSVNWESAIVCVEAHWQAWLHAALADRMAVVSQRTLGGVVSTLRRCAKEGLNPLRESDLLAIVDRFGPGEFAGLAAFIDAWADSEWAMRPSASLVEAYKTIPRKKKTSPDVVMRLDPELGPLIQSEQDALFVWLHQKWMHKQIDFHRYIYLRIKMRYGQRGVQLRMMVFGDFRETERGFKVRMPFAKQKGKAGWRTAFEEFNVDPEFYQLIQAYKTHVLQRLQQDYPDRANWERAIDHVPLFRAVLAGQGGVKGGYPILVDADDMHLLESASLPKFHISEGSIKSWLEYIQTRPDLPISTRTGKPIKITNEHRFRHTLGTDLATAGFHEAAIARALMHTNALSVRQYVQASAELMHQVDEKLKLNDELARTVHAFTGTIVKDQDAAKNGDSVEHTLEDTAVCGADSLCNLDAPYTCYACPQFQPLLHADHTSVLERLEARREEISDATTRAQFDNAILACREVIFLCDAMIQEEKNG